VQKDPAETAPPMPYSANYASNEKKNHVEYLLEDLHNLKNEHITFQLLDIPDNSNNNNNNNNPIHDIDNQLTRLSGIERVPFVFAMRFWVTNQMNQV